MAKKTTKTKNKTLAKKTPKAFVLQCEAPIAIEAAADGESPKRPTFKMQAYNGGLMQVSGFYRPVVVDLVGLRVKPQTAVLLDHDSSLVVGQSTDVKVSQSKITLSGVITGDVEDRDDPAYKVVLHAKNGFTWAASVGVLVDDLESISEDVKTKVNGKTFTGPVLVVRSGCLGEVSFVAVGADEKTKTSVAAAQAMNAEDANMDFETWLTAQGFTSADLDETQTTNLKAMFDREQVKDKDDKAGAQTDADPADGIKAAGDVGAGDVVTDMRVKGAAESQRISDVREKCGGEHPKIEAQAIKEGWTVEKCELEVLRASRPSGISGIHTNDSTMNGRILEAACMLTGRHAEAEKAFDEQTLEAASKRFRSGIGMQELILEAAWANGYTGRTFRGNERAVMEAAFNRNLQAGFSTIDISGILSNVANKFLVEGFFGVEQVWRDICAIRNVSDFKTITSHRLVGAGQYQQVAPGGELKHGTLGEASYANKADTYGLILSIDRQDMINDDLGALTSVPRVLGRGSGLKINDIFWTAFLANTDFFKAANNNYLEGADTALGINGLTDAEVAFMNQTDEDGKPIGVTPAIMLVPPALSVMASILHKSLEMRDTTSSTKYPVANPHSGKFTSKVSQYLSNSQYTGNSSKAWYLLANPADVAAIEVAFLNGKDSPTIETADADFNTLGVQMRGYHDFGVALQEPRGGVKMKGEA